MADEKQEYEVHVKLGRRGLIKRTPSNASDLVNMRGTGWTREGSPNAPSGDQVAKIEKATAEADKAREGRISPSSAVAAAANPDAVNAVPGEAAPKPSSKAKAASGTSASAAKADA